MFNITTATRDQLKAFCTENAIIVKGDKRCRDTFAKAIELFQSAKEAAVEIAKEAVEGAVQRVKETVTYDNAVTAAHFVNKWTRRSLMFLRSVVLVAIALALIAVDLVQNWQENKQFLVKIATRQMIRVRDRWLLWVEMGEAALTCNVTEPIAQKWTELMVKARSVFG